jgi:hypothetical protein
MDQQAHDRDRRTEGIVSSCLTGLDRFRGDSASNLGIAWAAVVFGTILTGGALWLRYLKAKQACKDMGSALQVSWRRPKT